MSTATAPPAEVDSPVFKPSGISRGIAAFSGGPGLVVKIVLLCVTNALAAWAAFVLVDNSKWIALAAIVAATAAIDAIYLMPRSWTLPAKFLVPGTIFLIAFQIIPIVYTVTVAFTNYSTGHIASKPDAIAAIKVNSLEPPPNGRQYTMAAARTADGKLVMILRDDTSGSFYAGDKNGLEPLAASDVTAEKDRPITGAKGYKLIQGAELFTLDAQLRTFTVPTTGDSAIRPQGIDQAVELRPTLRYDPARGVFVRISDGKVFTDNNEGSFVAGKEELEPGWRTGVGFQNFGSIIHDKVIRDPFLRVFVWTFAFATIPCSRPSRSGCSSRSPSTRRDCASSASTGRPSSSRGRSPASCRCSSGKAC